MLRLRATADALGRRLHHRPRLCRVWADGGYRGCSKLWARKIRVALINVQRPPGVRGFVKLPQRWVVERTFAWLNHHGRLRVDLEYKPRNSEGMLWLANLGHMLRYISTTLSS